MASVATIDFDAEFKAITDRLEREKERRLLPPLIRLWDGDWNLRGECHRENSAEFQFLDNETGVGQIEMPLDYYLSRWLADIHLRPTTNVFITVEKDGARWSGMMDELKIIKDEAGTKVVRVLFKHDYEHLKHIIVWANPFLPAEIQFPRTWLCFGRARWALKTTLMVNIMRLESSLWMLPDNPMDPGGWFNFDQSTWSQVVKPETTVDRSVGAIVHGRFKYMHDVSKKVAADGQLSWEARRYLRGDPPPWPGANLRHGCLVWDLVDKSAFNTGTSFGGSIFGGLLRELINIGGDGKTENVEQVDDPNVPGEYLVPGFRGTIPSMPGVVYRESEHTGIQSSEFSHKPATDVGTVAGGHSMPGVNELISAGIQMVGDLTAMIPGVPPLGGVADAVLKPLYCVAGDTMIDGPDGKERIDVLAERGGSFRVWSLTPDGRRVPATASFAFKKGNTDLYRYTLANGRTLTATAHHRWLTRSGWMEAKSTPIGVDVATVSDRQHWIEPAPQENLPDGAWAGVDEGSGVEYSPVVSVTPVGSQDFYDMTVPGWVNYAGNGIWNHNTDVFLAFGKWKSPQRAQRLGWSHYHEKWGEGADRAYTLSYLLAQRTAMYQTREVNRCTLTVADGAPWQIGQNGHGHFFIGDRVGFTILGMEPGRIFVEQVTELTLKWDRSSSPTWTIQIGQREPQDPIIKAIEEIQDIVSMLNELGLV